MWVCIFFVKTERNNLVLTLLGCGFFFVLRLCLILFQWVE